VDKNIEWLKAMIKEASNNADLKSFEAYTELLEHWENLDTKSL